MIFSAVITEAEEGGYVVSMHSEIKTGTLAGILRQAGVSADEFITVLKGWMAKTFENLHPQVCFYEERPPRRSGIGWSTMLRPLRET